MANEGELEGVVAQLLQAQERGDHVNRAEWFARHPHLAEELDAFFKAETELTPLLTPIREVFVEPEDATAVGPTLPVIESYEIHEELGRGGMGIVYKARDQRLDRVEALKVLIPGAPMTAEMKALMEEEARVVARLDHPNIVRLFLLGEHEGCPYLRLQYIQGGSLADRLARGRLSSRESARLVEQLARAMHHAHEQGVVHRDLKPSNVLLDGEVPRISDFGLALRLVQQQRGPFSGAVVGSAGYMAPEQARGDEGVGPLADVYGLGAILYECLTGRPPFRAAHAIEAILQSLVEPPIPPRRIVGGIDPRVEAICLRCLQKDPSARYPSAMALADALEKATRSPWKRRLVLLTVGVVLVCVAGLILWPRPQPVHERPTISQANIEKGSRLTTFRTVVADLESRPAGERSRSRYLSLSHLDSNDRPVIRARLDEFAKWWSQPGREVRIEPVEGTDLYRMDLGQMTPTPGEFWEEVTRGYPYGLGYSEVKDVHLREADAEIERLARSDLAIVRGDWFLHRVSKAGGEFTFPPPATRQPPPALVPFAREYEEETLSLEDIVRELDLTDAQLLQRFLREDQSGWTVGLRPLLQGERVTRKTWESLDLLFSPFQYISGELGLGTPIQAPQ